MTTPEDNDTVIAPDGTAWPSEAAWLAHKGVTDPGDLDALPKKWLDYICDHGVPQADGSISLGPGLSLRFVPLPGPPRKR